MGLQKVKFGGRIASANIRMVDVADGTKGRCILIDSDPRACIIGYDTANKSRCYADQESIIQFGLQARVYYIWLVARLNTTARGDVVDDTFVVEYLRTAESVYNEFVNAVEENDGNFDSILLTKEVKKEFSYVKIKPSRGKIDSSVLETIRQKASQLPIEQLWRMVEGELAQPIENYVRFLKENNKLPEDFDEVAFINRQKKVSALQKDEDEPFPSHKMVSGSTTSSTSEFAPVGPPVTVPSKKAAQRPLSNPSRVTEREVAKSNQSSVKETDFLDDFGETFSDDNEFTDDLPL